MVTLAAYFGRNFSALVEIEIAFNMDIALELATDPNVGIAFDLALDCYAGTKDRLAPAGGVISLV